MYLAKTLVLSAAAATALGACAGLSDVEPFALDDNYQLAQRTLPKGTPFQEQLYEGYLRLASMERAEYDWQDSAHYADKALAAAEGQDVYPDALYQRKLPGNSGGELGLARSDLTFLLEKGAARKAPRSTAEAQINFDCWIQEQEEDHQSKDITLCREAFYAALAESRRAVGLKALASRKLEDRYTVYFAFDSDRVPSEAEELIRRAASAVKLGQASSIELAGHSDKAGPADYNLALSARRLAAVRRLLLSAGLKDGQIEAAKYGEARPRVETAEGQAARNNRRVEINLLR